MLLGGGRVLTGVVGAARLLVQPLGRLHRANIVHVGGSDVVLRPPPAARPQLRLQQALPGTFLHLEGEGQEEGWVKGGAFGSFKKAQKKEKKK